LQIPNAGGSLKLNAMGELTHYFEVGKRFVKKNDNNSSKPGFLPIFEFPFTEDYLNWVKNLGNRIPEEGKKQWY
jgi:hypothetical protein